MTGPMLVWVLAVAGCSAPPDPRRTNFEVRREGVYAKYDPKTGRLAKLDVDTNKNGKIDTFSYRDGTTLHRIEIDQDEDGKIDRWENYGAGVCTTTRTGALSGLRLSRSNTG